MAPTEGGAVITIARIDGIARGWQGANVLTALAKAFPQGICGSDAHMFSARLNLHDERYTSILAILERAGLRPWTDARRMPMREKEYTLSYERHYDEQDLETCDYLELVPNQRTKGLYRDGPGVGPIVMDGPLTESIGFVFRPTWVIVQDRTRKDFESAGLRNLEFQPTSLRFEPVEYDLYDEEAVYWELRSNLTLPPVSSHMKLVHSDCTAFTGDFSRGCLRTEGFYTHPELHYRRADLATLEPFDLAHTYEMFHGGTVPKEDDRPLIASNRFYQVCKQHNIRTGWVPVRTDE